MHLNKTRDTRVKWFHTLDFHPRISLGSNSIDAIFFPANSGAISFVSVMVRVQSSSVSEENDQLLLLGLLLWTKEMRNKGTETLALCE